LVQDLFDGIPINDPQIIGWSRLRTFYAITQSFIHEQGLPSIRSSAHQSDTAPNKFCHLYEAAATVRIIDSSARRKADDTTLNVTELNKEELTRILA
jgi:hypothetical protein